MGAFIVKQPNGKYCRFSTVVDCPTHINMTEEDYIKVIMTRGLSKAGATAEAKDILQNHLYPYKSINEYFCPNNMSKKEFIEVKNKMKDVNGKFEIL